MIKLSELQNAYPTLPENCHSMMMRTAKNASRHVEKPKRNLRKCLVVAFVLILVLMSVAYATVRLGIIDYLIGHEKPTEALNSYAQTLNVREETDNIAITVTGAMYDGEKLALSYTVENLAPENLVKLRINSVSFGNEIVNPVFLFPGDDSWIPYAFGMQELSWSRNPVEGGMNAIVFSEPLRGQQEVAIHYSIERPNRPLVVVDEYLLEPLEAIENAEVRAEKKALMDGLLASGVVIADERHQDAEWWHAQGYSIVDRGGSFYWPEIEYGKTMSESEYDALMENAYETWSKEAQMKETGQGTLRFMVDADRGMEYRKEYIFIDGQQNQREVVLHDCTVRLERLAMTPLSTNLKFYMLPFKNTLEAAEALRITYGWLKLRDENEQELELASMEYACSNGLLRQDETGQWMVEWDWPLAGSIAFPSEIHIIAMADIEGKKTPTKEKAFKMFAERMRFRLK